MARGVRRRRRRDDSTTTKCRSTVCAVADAKREIIEWLERTGCGEATVTYKLRDWLFSRQRYWGEPFPIVYDELGPIAVPESMLAGRAARDERTSSPTTSDDPDALPEPPLARAADWVEVELDLPGPAWAGYGGGRARISA